jgi:hypothetical protein
VLATLLLVLYVLDRVAIRASGAAAYEVPANFGRR